jgi:ferritin-like metal-binding protein YciE
MANFTSLEELLTEELKGTYDAEKQLTKALPKMVKKASTGELRAALEEHFRQTEEHMERLEQVFEQLGLPVRGRKNDGIKQLIAEGDDLIGEAEDDDVRDAVMIAAAQKVEHYEIAACGTMRTWANMIGKSDVASILEDTLEEEKEADRKLTAIAESFVNAQAVRGSGADEEEEEGRTRGRARRHTRTARGSGRPVAADRARRR